MRNSPNTETSYASLHIRPDTRQRLNLLKASLQARRRRLVTQDEILNMLLDKHASALEGEIDASQN